MLSMAPFRSMLAVWLIVLSFISTALADEPQYVVATIDGQQWQVRDDRQPALYTADYGDCLGASAVNVTRFDAAYYKDNMTIIFHLAGETALTSEAIMMSIGVYAYGESRFDLTFNPCSANIESACPVRAGTPIEAAGIIPINQNDVSGQAILRIFSNSTQNEVGCFAAQITNGNTFQQKAAVGSTLGIFTFVAVLSSFVTTVYGDDIAAMRRHYAHSLSVLVVLAVWHHIFYSGALSMNWPSVLVAFWSNYAWAGGMIYSENMQNAINDFIGANKGNTSHVGAAGTGLNSPSLGGGYDIQQIYKRGALPEALTVQKAVAKRGVVDATSGSSGFKYYGQPVKPGLPLPGNYSGFAGTLAQERIPASNAFVTGLFWYLILIACVAVSIIVFKLALEGLSRVNLLRKDCLSLFRAHYIGYTAVALLRTLFIGFFPIAFLTMFQISYLASPGPVAVACVIFVGIVFGLGSLVSLACYYKITSGEYAFEPDRLNVEKRKVLRFFPWYRTSHESKSPRSEDKVYYGSMPWWTLRAMDQPKSIHSNESYIRKFGWLASRFRRTRWWFFVIWIVYEFIRGCFLAGASSKPTVQVFGLLIVEFIALIGFILLRPFEGQRLNVLTVYLLGFSKVATAALSAAFDTRFNLPRILATLIGIVIIVIQGVLTIVVMIAIVTGAVTSYMSMTRNREEMSPKRWNPMRARYFKHMDFRAQDTPQPHLLPVETMPEVPKSPYFNVHHVKRMAKVEDEDQEFMQEIQINPSVSQLSLLDNNRVEINRPFQYGRAASFQSQTSQSSRPRAARLHRPSWSTQYSGDSQGPGRRGAMSSSTTSAPEGFAQPFNRKLSRLNIQHRSLENIGRQPSPLSASQNGSKPAVASPLSQPYEDKDVTNVSGRAVSKLTSRSHSSSRSNLEPRISEEEMPPLPESSSTRGATGDERARLL